jgi:hypothetical protein
VSPSGRPGGQKDPCAIKSGRSLEIGTARVEAFSDGMMAVIITIMGVAGPEGLSLRRSSSRLTHLGPGRPPRPQVSGSHHRAAWNRFGAPLGPAPSPAWTAPTTTIRVPYVSAVQVLDPIFLAWASSVAAGRSGRGARSHWSPGSHPAGRAGRSAGLVGRAVDQRVEFGVGVQDGLAMSLVGLVNPRARANRSSTLRTRTGYNWSGGAGATLQAPSSRSSGTGRLNLS